MVTTEGDTQQKPKCPGGPTLCLAWGRPLATLWLQEGVGKAFSTQASMGSALSHACSWHSMWADGQNEGWVS